jgi:MoaA/NifB/PqqE/SkfB family radical SAM enzyme
MNARYSRLKIFHYPAKLASLPRENPAILPPLHIRIKPTNICGHQCRYCSYRNHGLQLGKDMAPRDSIPREKMAEIIQDCIELGVKAITFSGGGDPFCYPHLEEAARMLADSPVRFAALTNGARLEGQLAEIFAHHASWIRISIDGWNAESYARYRGVRETEFGRIVENMRNFTARKGPCRLGVSLIVDAHNAAHVYDQAVLAKSAGAASLKISPLVVSDDGEENNAYHAPHFTEVTRQAEAARRDLADNTFEIYNAFHRQETGFEKPYTWCPYLQILTVIGADLRVYACQDKAYNLDSGLIGLIREARFRDFWMKNKEKFFTINPVRDCNHHCVADGKNRLIHEFLAAGFEHGEFV